MSSMGGCYNLRYLGNTPLSKFTSGFSVLQKPLRDLYVSYLTPRGPRPPVASRLALTDRGIILTLQGNDSFYSMREVLLWEAVHWVRVQVKDKKFMAAFEPIDPDRHRGKDSLFSKLDSQYKYLTKLNHEPLLACVLRRTTGPKTIDVHAFVCRSEEEVCNIVSSIALMQQQFEAQEAQRTGIFEYKPFQEPPGSVRVQSGHPAVQLSRASNELVNPNGFISQRQVRPDGRREGEITLEELVLLADRALAEPMKNGAVSEAPAPFRMGESWAARENHHGVRRSKTFNEGQKRNGVAESRIAGQDRYQSQMLLEPQAPFDASRGGASGNGTQDARYYENVNGQQRTYENLGVPGSNPIDDRSRGRSPVPQPRLLIPQQQQQQQPFTHGSLDERDAARMSRHQQQQQQQQLKPVDPQKRKSVPPESLRMVIAESKMANKRTSVLPGADRSCSSGSAFNLSAAAGDSRAPAFVEVYSDVDQVLLQPNPSPKPVAMVQPRKVPGVKVLPEPALEGFQLHKVGKGLDEQKKEQYQRGDGAVNRNHTRSMFELNNAVANPTTPQAPKKFSNPEPDPVGKKPNVEPEPERKSSSLEAANRDGREKAAEKPSGEREKKDAELEAFAMNICFNKPPTNTLSPHGTNFESALGYFP